MVRESRKSDLSLWFCRGCDEVHMTFGERDMVSFNRREFGELARAVEELGWDLQVEEGKPLSVVDLAAKGDPVH